jgi:hypothetical protein
MRLALIGCLVVSSGSGWPFRERVDKRNVLFKNCTAWYVR